MKDFQLKVQKQLDTIIRYPLMHGLQINTGGIPDFSIDVWNNTARILCEPIFQLNQDLLTKT